jgi:hypothetical protein
MTAEHLEPGERDDDDDDFDIFKRRKATTNVTIVSCHIRDLRQYYF